MSTSKQTLHTAGLSNAGLSKDEAICIIVQGPGRHGMTPAGLTSRGDRRSLLLTIVSRHSGCDQLEATVELVT
jgi:hypothetical protein